jgi:hypothetical protein
MCRRSVHITSNTPALMFFAVRFLQADVKMRVGGTNPAAVSFGVSPNPCTCDRRLESALTPQAALPEAHIAALQKHKRMP